MDKVRGRPAKNSSARTLQGLYCFPAACLLYAGHSAAFNIVMQYMGLASYMPNDIIFKQGDFGDQFYIILSGAVDVLVADEDKLGVVSLSCCQKRAVLRVHGAT